MQEFGDVLVVGGIDLIVDVVYGNEVELWQIDFVVCYLFEIVFEYGQIVQ